jgi:hypothetical protein
MEKEKKLDGLEAVTLEQLYSIVSTYDEDYWRNYNFWHKRSNLSYENKEEFYKLESASGMAKFDDPPEGWGKEQLFLWALGNVHGREVETSNISGVLRFIKYRLKELLNKEQFGFREKCPTLYQVEVHSDRSVLGMWILNYKLKDHDFFSQFPQSTCLKVEKDKIRYFQGDEKWKVLTKKEQNKIASYMPLSSSGLPGTWPKEKNEKSQVNSIL